LKKVSSGVCLNQTPRFTGQAKATAYGRGRLHTHVTTGARHDKQCYLDQLDRVCNEHQVTIVEALADRGYGAAAIIRELEQRGIRTFIPLWSSRVGNIKYLTGDLVYEREADRFRCPQANT